jgi:hypothetical protein
LLDRYSKILTFSGAATSPPLVFVHSSTSRGGTKYGTIELFGWNPNTASSSNAADSFPSTPLGTPPTNDPKLAVQTISRRAEQGCALLVSHLSASPSSIGVSVLVSSHYIGYSSIV